MLDFQDTCPYCGGHKSQEMSQQFAVVTQQPGNTVYVETAQEWEKHADDLVNAHTDWCDTRDEAERLANELSS